MVTAEQLHESVEGQTITRLLRRNAQRFAERPALTTGPGPDAGTLSWAQLLNDLPHVRAVIVLDWSAAPADDPRFVSAVLSRAEQVKRHRVRAGPWTAETGELTPKLSLRRRAIDGLHAVTMESMYT
ncbi:hypothetical protein [Streptomyces sp. NPDC057877]|uniref:hypothetical protein n=1 Tax=Streptomyces sp. NPDC057877 TaxID=3346269 RepID=UPI003678D13A